MLIRFKKNDGTEYPQWEEKRLGEICNIFAGGTPSTNKSEYWGPDILWIQSGLVQNCIINAEDIKTSISKLGLSKSSAKMIEPNSVLLAMTGATCGNVGYLTCDACANQSVMAFEPLKDNAKFLYYLLINNRNYILNYQAGGAQAGVNKKSCINFSFEFPCLEEQQKIADFLSTVDQKIEAQRVIVADYEEFKKGTMQKIFNQEVRFKDDDGNEFPVWEEKRLLDILEQSITDGPHETPNIVEKGIPFISVDAIVDNRIDFSRKRGYITLEYNELCNKKYSPKREDVYLVKSGSTVGKVAIVETDDVFNIWSPLAAMRVDKNNSAYFLYYLLQTENIQKQIRIKSFGGTQPNLSMRVLERFVLNIPCLEEQKKIADCLSALDKKIEAEKKILADLEELKKGLLQGIFNN